MKKLIIALSLVTLTMNVANAQAPTIPAGQSFLNGVGIGVPVGPNCPSNAALHIKADNNNSYSSGNGQQLIYCETTQAPGDNLRISNGKGGVGSTFSPIISGNVESDSMGAPLTILGATSSAKDVSGGTAMLRFWTSTNFNPSTSCISGASIGNITKRPLFQWGNGTLAPLMTMNPTTTANGDAQLGLGTLTPAYKLDIAIPAGGTTGYDGIRITNANSSGATLRLNSTSAGGTQWTLISGGSLSGVGAGNFALYNFTSGLYYMTANRMSGNIGIGTAATPATHKLHVKATTPNTDPVRFETLRFANDSSVVTVDATGVLHQRTIASLGTSGISNACTTIGNVPVTSTTTGNLACSQITDNGTQVGISTTTPAAKLHILSPGGFSGPSLRCERNDGTNQTNALDVIITSNGLTSAALGAGTINFISRNLTPGAVPDMAFSANNADQQLIIKNNGNIAVGTTAPTNRLHIKPTTGLDPVRIEDVNFATDSSIVTIDAAGVLHKRAATSLMGVSSSCTTIGNVPVTNSVTGNLACSQITDNGAGVGVGMTAAVGYKLDVNGAVRMTSLLVTSDAKYKKDITPIENANDIISKLNGVTYNWRKDEFKNKNFSAQKQLGFIAQEVEKVLPEAVSKDVNGDYAVNYIEIIPVLTEAMKQQNAKIEALENQLAEIKALLVANKPTTTISETTSTKVYPNPVENGTLNIELFTKTEGAVTVMITDLEGRSVNNQRFVSCANCTNKFAINTLDFQSGVYNITILSEGKTLNEKFTVVK